MVVSEDPLTFTEQLVQFTKTKILIFEEFFLKNNSYHSKFHSEYGWCSRHSRHNRIQTNLIFHLKYPKKLNLRNFHPSKIESLLTLLYCFISFADSGIDQETLHKTADTIKSVIKFLFILKFNFL